MPLGASEVLQLAPDEASAKAAKGLVVPAKWPRLEWNDEAVWGECQGSGSRPYQVQVDQAAPAFRCTCPSRKFPCKHGLALLLLLAQHSAAFTRAEPPSWVVEWLASRRQRAQKQEEKAAGEGRKETADPESAAKRETARRQRMAGGVDELERWLADRLQQGLAQLPGPGQEDSLWRDMAAHLVDAQLPGLAWRLRRLASRVGQGEGWPARLLAGFGQLRLLIAAFRRLDVLPPGLAQDVRSALGLPLDRETVLAEGEKIADHWRVLGQGIDEEDRLWVRRVWLQGEASGRRALFLDYAHGSRRFEPHYVTGSQFAASLAFFPGNAPLRALLAGESTLLPVASDFTVSATLSAALDGLATALAGNPWQWPQAFLSTGVPGPTTTTTGWRLYAEGGELPLRLQDDDGWRLTAVAGGAPLGLFGEWDGETLRPLTAWNPGLLWTEETIST